MLKTRSIYGPWPFAGLGNRSFALSLFALFKKSAKERFALLLFSKRAKKSDSLFCSFLKERKRAIRSFALLKRAKKSDSLFCSIQKERQRANRSFALFKKSERAHKRANHSFFTFSLFLKSESLFFRSF